MTAPASRRAAPQVPQAVSTAEIVLTTLHAGGKFGGQGLPGLGRPARRRHLGRQRPLHPARSSRSTATASTGRPSSRRAARSSGRSTPSARPRGPEHRRAAHGHHGHLLARRDRSSTRPSSGPRPSLERMQIMAFLNKGLEIRFADERTDPRRRPPSSTPAASSTSSSTSTRPRSRSSARWPPSNRPRRTRRSRSRCSGTPASTSRSTPSPTGSPPSRAACTRRDSQGLTNAVNRYARATQPLKEKEDNLQGEDIREGLTAIISVRLRDPQFEGQTKAKLGNVSIRSLVERATNEKLSEWLEENPREANQIVPKSTQAARARWRPRAPAT